MTGPRRTRTLTAAPVVRLMAARLMLREGAPGLGARRLLWGSSLGVVIGLGALWGGVHHVAVVAGVGLCAMGVLAGICLRLFLPAMAVSVIGVALACSSLMTALSVTAGFELEITRALARLNGHVLLTKYGLDFFEYEQVADRWKADPQVTAASPFAFSMVVLVHEPSGEGEPAGAGADVDDPAGSGPDAAEAAEVAEDDPADAVPPAGPVVVVGKGVDPRRAVDLDGFGRLFGAGDPVAALRPGDSRHRPGLVLGRGLAARVGVEVGDRVRVVVPAEIRGEGQPVGEARHSTFEVTDLLVTGTSELDRNLALMHITAAQAMFFREGRVTGIEFELHDPDRADTFADTMAQAMPPIYRVSTWREANSPLLIGLEQIRLTLSLVLGLMVVVAASSLIASLLLLVRRKGHDIAVIMAVGGTRSLVFWVFEGIGLLAGLVGAVLGLAMGGLYCLVIDTFHYPLGGDIYPVDHLPVVVRAIDALGPAVAAIALCGLASGPVAMLAARVHMIRAMRR
ncbi:MAG: hypothetical protein AAGF11_36060 [Myxococcota bacterium]